MSDSLIFELLAIVLCIVLSSFFSGSETTLTSLSEMRVRRMMDENPKNKPLTLWLDHPNKVLNTILIGNNIVNILASVLATDFTAKVAGNSNIALVTGIMTLLVLIFGEITPKTYAKHNAEKHAVFIIKTLKVPFVVFYPLSYALNKLVRWIIILSGGNVEKSRHKITEDELEFYITESGKEGMLEDNKTKMLQNIFDISEIYVKEVMVPRTDMVAVDVNAPAEEYLDRILASEFSRIPVYEDSIDRIVGILYVKDLLKFVKEDGVNFDLKKVIRKPFFVPETKKIDSMMGEFQKSRNHMAVVIDEYGGVAGIVTLEDILEEIVGEIWDEYDTEEHEVVQTSDDTYIVDVRMDIDDFCEKFELEKTHDMEEYETLGGLVFDIAGKIPEVGEVYEFDGYSFKILNKNERRLDKVELTRLHREPEDNEENSAEYEQTA
ncbi:hemolysin family protein [Seleniivibrio sp.]|uniref:hemolysin family protein n=1 Tax=Seleniivibrio sp. TaxID=2898801 RepID=UPI0025E661B8|nr:hemolysin family protein [Seleniivibrio sp.]MCD8552805.1 hemolysin family protein [Seleniivibrio sp.]